jgi:hypothetical protein
MKLFGDIVGKNSASATVCLVACLAYGVFCPATWADQTDYPTAQKTGVIFQLPVGARGTALGQGISADAQGLEALSWNPAGLIHGGTHELLADYANLYEDVSAETVGYAYRTPGVSWGAMATYISYGSIDRTQLDEYGYPVRTQQVLMPSSLLAKIGGAGRLSPQISAGATVKWLREDLVDQVYNYFAGDVGVEVLTGLDGLKCAAQVRNIGRAVGEFSLPLATSVGVAYRMPVGLLNADELMLALDGILPESESLQAGAGLEYQFLGKAFLRAGYRSGDTRAADNLLTGFSFGLGMALGAYALQYAYSPNSLIGDGHRITLEYQIGPAQETDKKQKKVVEKKEGQYLFEYLK